MQLTKVFRREKTNKLPLSPYSSHQHIFHHENLIRKDMKMGRNSEIQYNGVQVGFEPRLQPYKIEFISLKVPFGMMLNMCITETRSFSHIRYIPGQGEGDKTSNSNPCDFFRINIFTSYLPLDKKSDFSMITNSPQIMAGEDVYPCIWCLPGTMESSKKPLPQKIECTVIVHCTSRFLVSFWKVG